MSSEKKAKKLKLLLLLFEFLIIHCYEYIIKSTVCLKSNELYLIKKKK